MQTTAYECKDEEVKITKMFYGKKFVQCRRKLETKVLQVLMIYVSFLRIYKNVNMILLNSI